MAIELPWTHKTPKQPAFIVGTGPSILDEPLNLIDESQQHVYLCNHAWKALEMGLLHKCNAIAYTGLSSWIHQLDGLRAYDQVTKFYSDLIVNSYEFKTQASEYDRYYLFDKTTHNKDGSKDVTSGWLPSDITQGIGKTGSITLDMAVICYLIGYTKIYLLGMDLDYTLSNPYFCESTAHNYKMSAPTVKEGLRTGMHARMVVLSQILGERDVELINLSRGYKPEQYNKNKLMPVDRLENVLDGVVKPKAIGCIFKGAGPVTPKDIKLITYARTTCDKLIIACVDTDMEYVMNAIRFVDGAIVVKDKTHILKELRQQYPKDSIRIFEGEDFKHYNAD